MKYTTLNRSATSYNHSMDFHYERNTYIKLMRNRR